MEDFVYDPLANMLHCRSNVVFRERNGYTTPNAADEAILNEHFYSDVIEEPKPTPTRKESDTWQPTGDGYSKRQTEGPLNEDSPPKPKERSRELAGLKTSRGDAWKPLAKGSRRYRAGKLAESAQFALEDEGFEDMNLIDAAAAISDDHEDGIDNPKSYKAATESTLAKKWDNVMKAVLYAIGEHHVFGDFVELPEGRKALPNHWVYKIMRDGAGNVQRFKARLVCGGHHHIQSIDCQATYAPTARRGHDRLGLAIAINYNLTIHQMDVCTGFSAVDL